MTSSSRTTQQSKNEKPQPITKKSNSDRQQRLNRLAQPKGRILHSLDHVRSHYIQPITVKDLFGNIDDISNCNSLLSEKSGTTINDTRFQQLIETCSAVHKPEKPSTFQSVQNIVQSNPSLQDEEGRWQLAHKPKSRTVELKKHIRSCSEIT